MTVLFSLGFSFFSVHINKRRETEIALHESDDAETVFKLFSLGFSLFSVNPNMCRETDGLDAMMQREEGTRHFSVTDIQNQLETLSKSVFLY